MNARGRLPDNMFFVSYSCTPGTGIYIFHHLSNSAIGCVSHNSQYDQATWRKYTRCCQLILLPQHERFSCPNWYLWYRVLLRQKLAAPKYSRPTSWGRVEIFLKTFSKSFPIQFLPTEATIATPAHCFVNTTSPLAERYWEIFEN